MGVCCVCVWEMRVCIKRLLVVFLVSVQCGGVTEDFEADCTITDNINKIVRRLRLSSSKPLESLESTLFESQEVEQTINDQPKLDSLEHVDESDRMSHVMEEKKREKVEKVMISKGRKKSKKLILKRNKSEDMDGKCPISYEYLADKSDLDLTRQRGGVPAHSNYSSIMKNISYRCVGAEESGASKIQKEEMIPKNITTQLNTNKTKQNTLLLPSCTYVDLTAVQDACGPGYKAMVDKLQQHLHHSIFFDSSSGHIIYAVHEDTRWQCCKTRKNLTKDVQCTMGTRC